MEDLLVCVEAFLKCERIAIDAGAYYHYRVHESSTVMAFKPHFYQRQKQAFAKLQELLVREGKAAELATRLGQPLHHHRFAVVGERGAQRQSGAVPRENPQHR